MARSDDKDELFTVRTVNVTKLARGADCDILIAECDFAIDDILRRLKSGDEQRSWIVQAEFALAEIRHKRRMLEMKKADLAERAAEIQRQSLNSRFRTEAEIALPPDVFAAIYKKAAMVENAS
jgi:hypothetical protein